MADGSNVVIVDSHETIAGYRVERVHTLDDGRIVLVDRGAQYRHRYVVGWHPPHHRGWVDAILVDAFEQAIDRFVQRVNAEKKRRFYAA